MAHVTDEQLAQLARCMADVNDLADKLQTAVSTLKNRAWGPNIPPDVYALIERMQDHAFADAGSGPPTSGTLWSLGHFLNRLINDKEG